MSHVVEEMVLATFKDHFYRWDGEVYRQEQGVAMGMRASGALARWCLDDWAQKFRKLLQS